MALLAGRLCWQILQFGDRNVHFALQTAQGEGLVNLFSLIRHFGDYANPKTG